MLKNKFIVGVLLAIPVLNVLFYFLAQRREGASISAEDVAIAGVGLAFFVLLVVFTLVRARRSATHGGRSRS